MTKLWLARGGDVELQGGIRQPVRSMGGGGLGGGSGGHQGVRGFLMEGLACRYEADSGSGGNDPEG